MPESLELLTYQKLDLLGTTGQKDCVSLFIARVFCNPRPLDLWGKDPGLCHCRKENAEHNPSDLFIKKLLEISHCAKENPIIILLL